jgi:hypothetical protein
MREISDWIGTLSADERKMLKDLMDDGRNHGMADMAAMF